MAFMRLALLPLTLGLLAVLLSSCASERKVTYAKGEQTGVGRYQSDVQFVQDKDGSIRPNKDVRSQFDGKQEYLGQRDIKGKQYASQDFRRERWGGNTKFDADAYSGNQDASRYKHSPHFVQQQASAQGKKASMGGQNFATGNYATASASENKAKRHAHKSDAKTDRRREVYVQPRIISRGDYNKLNVEDTRSMMGR